MTDTPRRLLLLIGPLALLVLGVVGWRLGSHLGVDSAVYRSGGVALVHGQPLYDADTLPAEPSWARLPFTYPPVAALLFVPLTLLPTQVSWGLLGGASLLGLAAVVRICGRTSGAAGPVLALSALLCGLEPVWRTLALGQVNLILLAMIVADALVVRRHGGVLIGIAAAVKLTPLIFVLYLLVTGRRADAARAAGVFAALQLLMLVLVPHDTVRFWTHAVSDPARTGPVDFAENQSLHGLLLRVTHSPSVAIALAVVLALLLAVPTLLLVRRLHAAGQVLPALLATALLGLLASPVSWTHHWVWAAPLVLYLWTVDRRLALAGYACFAAGALLLLNRGQGVRFDPSALSLLVDSVYLIGAAGAAAVLVRASRPAP